MKQLKLSWNDSDSKFKFKDYENITEPVSDWILADRHKSGGPIGVKISFFKDGDIIDYIRKSSEDHIIHFIATFKELSDTELLVVSKMRNIIIVNAVKNSVYIFSCTSNPGNKHSPCVTYSFRLLEQYFKEEPIVEDKKKDDNKPKSKPNNSKKKVSKNSRSTSTSK